MRLTPSLLFGLKAGAVMAVLVTAVITAWEWLENPGGIFHGPDGTNWSFVYDTATSWLLPTFAYVAVISFLIHAAWHWVVRRRRAD